MGVAAARAWRRWLAPVLVAAALCWPALLNGQAFLFSDTPAYLKGAAAGFEKFLHLSSPWLAPGPAAAAGAPTPPASRSTPGAAQAADFESSPEKKGVLAGRSVYYGAFVLAAYHLAGLWAPVFLQGLLAVAAIGIALRASRTAVLASPGRAWGFVALMVLGTSLPFFVSVLMPDLLTGLAILMAATLLAFELTPGQRGGCLATLCFAALAHSSNLLVMGAVLAAFIAMSLGRRQAAAPVLRSGALVLGAVCVGLAGELATAAVVQRSTGQAPIRPPFLMARLITDGPGADWARAHCASSPYVVCRYAANFGQGSSDDFLWDHDPRIGVFSVASRDERVALAQEQLAFARDVVAAYPWRVAADAARNFGRQLTLTGISQFTYGPAEVDYFAHKIPATDFAHLKDTLAAARRFPNTRLASVQALVSVLSAAGARRHAAGACSRAWSCWAC